MKSLANNLDAEIAPARDLVIGPPPHTHKKIAKIRHRNFGAAQIPCRTLPNNAVLTGVFRPP